MVEERERAGAKALSDWLGKCRVVVAEVKGATFVKLLELFNSGISIIIVRDRMWVGQLGPVEKIQTRAARIFWEWGGSIHQSLYNLKYACCHCSDCI